VATLQAAYGDVWRACFAGAADADELEQRFLSRLLVSTPERSAAISAYGGRGTLRSWLRVAATRLRVDAHRRDEAAERAERGAAAVPLPRAGLEPELDYLKLHYRAEFEAALSDGWRELEPRERNLLRHALLDGLSATHVADVYGVHRSTAKRWLADARARLLETTRNALRQRLRVDDRELDSVLRLVESRLDVTARVFLQTREG
jgi:RNA polymerase sigma-70 factor (ECF subfamily)